MGIFENFGAIHKFSAAKNTGLSYLNGALLAVTCAPGLLAADPVPAVMTSAPGVDNAGHLAGTLAPWVSRASVVGEADENQRVVITAYLSWRSQASLEQLVADLTNPASTNYGHILTPAQFHSAFSPLNADVKTLQETLSGLGFKIEDTPTSGLFVKASGTVAQIKQVFRVSQHLYSYRGKTLRAHAEDPTLPSALAQKVTYIGGLDESGLLKRPASTQNALLPLPFSLPLPPSLAQPASRSGGAALSPAAPNSVIPPDQLTPPAGGPSRYPCSHYWGDQKAKLQTTAPFPFGDQEFPWTECGYNPQQIREAYGSNRVSETGHGVRIAITDIYTSPTIVADVNRYSANHGLPSLTHENFEQILLPGATQVPSNDPCGYQSWWSEQTLDVTAVHSVAPDAKIIYVGGACNATDSVDGGVAVDPLYFAIDTRLADIVSNSWLYNGEADVPSGQLFVDNLEFIQAALQGMSVLFAAGDDGDLTLSGAAFGGPNPVASGSWPATSPFVTALGGTSLLLRQASGEKSEYGWADWETIFNNPLIGPGGTTVSDQGQGWITPFLWVFGGGGGPSLKMPEPFYQWNVVPTLLATQTYLADGTPDPLTPPRRVTPDIAMDADTFTGLLDGETYSISTPPADSGCTATGATTEYCEEQVGGTSLATPLFAGVLALVNEHRLSIGRWPIGFVNPVLYRLPIGSEGSDAPIIDVNAPTEPMGALIGVYGYNDIAGFVGVDSNLGPSGSVIENVDSSLRSAPGYDNVTGLGAPNVPALIRALE